MEISEYRNIYQHESSHFFYTANHSLIVGLVRKYSVNDTSLKILDAGCGTGLLAKQLSKIGSTMGVDIASEALRYAKRRKIRVRKASVNNLPFPDNSFNVVVSMDVLYHQRVDDTRALFEFFRVLKPGGIAIIRVPANKWLHLLHDKHVHTRDRYTKNSLYKKLKSAGFFIVRLSYINSILLPLACIRQSMERLFGLKYNSSGVSKLPVVINTLLKYFLLIENRVFEVIDLPFGLGLIVVVKKPI